MLAILNARAKEDGQVDGLIPHLVDGCISIIQYADDTIIFMEHDLEKALNMKLILCIFKELPGLKIISIRVRCFVLGKLKMWRMTILLSSDVNQVCSHLGIWEYLYTFVI
jgi:hypothetical protein